MRNFSIKDIPDDGKFHRLVLVREVRGGEVAAYVDGAKQDDVSLDHFVNNLPVFKLNSSFEFPEVFTLEMRATPNSTCELRLLDIGSKELGKTV